MRELKLKRHETFSIREGWLEKAINYINENDECFKKENGTQILGLGSNMVKSLRYWIKAANITETTGNAKIVLSNFGETLIKYDRYLNDKFSLWFIHYHLSSNFNNNPIFNEIFNLSFQSFDKEYLFSYLNNKLTKEFNEVSSSSLDSDISIFLKSYYAEEVSNPEENMNCPLAKLKLLSLENGIYNKKTPTYFDLDYRVIYFALLSFINTQNTHTISFNIEDILEAKDNPLNIFNLTKSVFFSYLDEMKKDGLLTVVKTAGLNTITIERQLSLDEIFCSYFKGVN
ncbi:MAG: DUF4007 family protein [bacterium]